MNRNTAYFNIFIEGEKFDPTVIKTKDFNENIIGENNMQDL